MLDRSSSYLLHLLTGGFTNLFDIQQLRKMVGEKLVVMFIKSIKYI